MYMYFLCRYAGSLQSCNICFCIATDWSISFTCTCISYAGMQVVCSHVIYVFVLLLIGLFHLHVHVFLMQVCR